MNVTFKNSLLKSIQETLTSQGYKATDTDKKNRSSYVNYNSLRDGAFETTAKPSWMDRIFEHKNINQKIDQTRLTFLKGVVSEYLLHFEFKEEEQTYLPNGIQRATVNQLMAFVKKCFPKDLKAALKINDYGEWGIRIPLSSFRVKTAMDELGKYIKETERSSVYSPENIALDENRVLLSPEMELAEAHFNDKMLPEIEDIKKMSVGNENQEITPLNQLSADVQKFNRLVTLFFGDKKDLWFEKDKQTVGEVLGQNGYTPNDLLTSKDPKKIVAYWRDHGNALCRVLANAAEKMLDGKAKNFYDALKASLSLTFNRFASYLMLQTNIDKQRHTLDTFDKFVEYVFVKNAKFTFSQTNDISEGARYDDNGALNITQRGVSGSGMLARKTHANEVQEGNQQ